MESAVYAKTYLDANRNITLEISLSSVIDIPCHCLPA
jgi:hypothetical protein